MSRFIIFCINGLILFSIAGCNRYIYEQSSGVDEAELAQAIINLERKTSELEKRQDALTKSQTTTETASKSESIATVANQFNRHNLIRS